MNIFTKFFFIISFSLIGISNLFPQGESGVIYGTVTDSITGEALTGANVWLKGYSLGAATDIEGKYTIPRITPGSYILTVRYIGYKTKEIPIKVTSGANIEKNVVLLIEAIEGEVITITGQAKGQQQAINTQLTSPTIINVVSAEKIRELPDDNAATALSRLPGVSLMNGDQIVIRGVEAKLNQILVNGIELPSTDMNNRATNLGFISSNMLSSIEVVKALTPDMDANTLGGVVNLRLMEAPTGLHFDALAQGNYNSTDRTANNYKFWASVSQRFFKDKLGVFLQGNMDRTDGGDQTASITPNYFGTNQNEYGQATYITNGANLIYNSNIIENSGGSLILDYKLPHGKLVLQNTYSGNVTDQLRNYILLNFDNNRVIYTPDRSLYGKDLWINALQAENTFFGDFKVNASLSHSSTNQYTRYGYSPGINGAGWSQFYNAGSTAPFGTDNLGNPIRYDQNEQMDLTLTDVLGIFNNLDPADASNATIQGWTQSIWNGFDQRLYNASLDLSKPINFSNSITTTFKAGGKYIRTTRENDINEYFAHTTDDLYRNPEANAYLGVSAADPVRFSDVMNNDFARGKYYLNDLYDFTNGGFKYTLDRNRYDDWLQLSQKGWLVPYHHGDSYQDDWNGSEQFAAGYLMGTINIGPQVTLLGGVRYESYNMNYHAEFTYVTHTVFGDAVSTADGAITVNDSINPFNPHYQVPYNAFNVDRWDDNLFPSVQLQYKPNDWSDVRLAYTTGISRPDYTAIIPKVAFYVGNFEMGNPYLKPATAQNFDIIASFHSNTIGLFTINAFYKEIKDQMYNTSIYYVNRAQYTGDVYIPDSLFLAQRFGFTVNNSQQLAINLNNPNMGFIRGIEIDWQTVFWYLPRPFNSLVLNVNYTKSGSNTVYNILIPTTTTTVIIDPNTGRPRQVTNYSTIDSVYEGRLIQQANDVVNAAIGVDYKGFSGRISFSMTGNLLNTVGNRPETSSFTGNIYRWDFTLKQELPIDGLSIALNGVNIFHNGVETYRNYRTSPGAPVTKNLVSVLYSPTVFQMNLRYTF